jgi:hypothetical protein
MIRTDNWHIQAIEELQTLLMPRDDVIAFALFGSALSSNDAFNSWSDLDCLLAVKDEAYSRFFPVTEWLEPFGNLYTHQQSETIFYGTLRTCFVDFRRLDIVVTTPSRLNRLSEWARIPFWGSVRLLFSRSDQITQLLSQVLPMPEPTFASQSQFDEMVDHFWFKAMLAGYKVIRDDRLIALHLALDLVRDCCVLGMTLRDRSEGTNIHRAGGLGNNVVANLENTCTSYTAAGILDIIEQSALQFDRLASQWSETYHEKRYPLIEWLGHIRRTVSTGE